jgi:predicted nuclease with TOPRIM domain
MDWEEKYNSLLRKYNRLERENEQLKEKYDKTYEKLDHANYRISEELEPRIKSEKRAYDRWVTDPERGKSHET